MVFQTGPFQCDNGGASALPLTEVETGVSDQSGFCVTPLSLHLLKEGRSGVTNPLWVASIFFSPFAVCEGHPFCQLLGALVLQNKVAQLQGQN